MVQWVDTHMWLPSGSWSVCGFLGHVALLGNPFIKVKVKYPMVRNNAKGKETAKQESNAEKEGLALTAMNSIQKKNPGPLMAIIPRISPERGAAFDHGLHSIAVSSITSPQSTEWPRQCSPRLTWEHKDACVTGR